MVDLWLIYGWSTCFYHESYNRGFLYIVPLDGWWKKMGPPIKTTNRYMVMVYQLAFFSPPKRTNSWVEWWKLGEGATSFLGWGKSPWLRFLRVLYIRWIRVDSHGMTETTIDSIDGFDLGPYETLKNWKINGVVGKSQLEIRGLQVCIQSKVCTLFWGGRWYSEGWQVQKPHFQGSGTADRPLSTLQAFSVSGIDAIEHPCFALRIKLNATIWMFARDCQDVSTSQLGWFRGVKLSILQHQLVTSNNLGFRSAKAPALRLSTKVLRLRSTNPMDHAPWQDPHGPWIPRPQRPVQRGAPVPDSGTSTAAGVRVSQGEEEQRCGSSVAGPGPWRRFIFIIIYIQWFTKNTIKFSSKCNISY